MDYKKLIADAIATQGNQVGSSNALAQILGAIVPVEVDDITKISKEILDALEVGQTVIKKTGVQKHAYKVSYKGDGAGQGICLTYADASVIETVSYDRTESGWAYNSTDKWEKA